MNNSQRNLTSTETDKSLFLRKNKSLYVEKSARSKSMKYRFLTYIKKAATIEFQKDMIYKSLFTKNEFVKKFIDQALINRLRLQEITDYHYNILNDYSTINATLIENQNLKDQTQTVDFQQKITHHLTSIISLLNFIPLILPENKFKILWDLVSTFGRLYFLFLIPIELAWTQQHLLYSVYKESTIFWLIILLIDLILSLNTAYYQSGQLVISRMKIVKHILSKAYGMEWISTFIIMIFMIVELVAVSDLNVNKNLYLIILLLFLVHLKSVHDKVSEYEMALNLQKITAIYIELMKFVLLIYYAIHLFACIWFWAGEYSYIYYQNSWLSTLQDDWQQQYLQSFYYACVTMYSIGYGDITPVSNLEKVIAIILIMVSSIQLSYSINTVGNIIQKISFYSEERKNNLSIINQYMSRKNIPMSFQMQIREYLNKYWQSKNQENSSEETNIIQQLSEELQQKLMMYSNQAIIKSSPFLKNFSHQFKYTLLKKVSIQNLHPEKFLTCQDQFLGYVEEGEIEIIPSIGQNNFVEKIKKGEYFGLKNFVSGELISHQFRSQSFSKVLVLQRKDFLLTIRDFPIDYELFCQIKDRLIFGKENHYIEEHCKSCKSQEHNVENCPLIHFVPSKGFIIKKHQFSNYQNRAVFKRKQLKKSILQMNYEDLNYFYQQYEDELRLYNIPNFSNNDIDEFNQLPKFKPQQSVAQSPQIQRNTTIMTEQFEGIQRQVSLVTSIARNTQKKPSYLQNSVQKSSSAEVAASLDGQIHNRLLHLYCFKEYFKNEILQLELLEKQKKNLTERTQNIQFDCLYNFQAYNAHQNIDVIVKKLQPKQTKLLKLPDYISRFIQYLEYPAAFFEKYKHYQIQKFRNNSFVDRIMEGD